MAQKIFFEKNQFYHICTRAVERRSIFTQSDDCFRFLFYMYAANIGSPEVNLYRRDVEQFVRSLLNGEEPKKKLVIKEHEPLVNIASFILVGDHVHLLLYALSENGIPKFMQKLKTAFAKYFNLKHEREGTLFARPYKAVPVTTDVQLTAVLFYINIKNGLDVWRPGWKKGGINDHEWESFFQFLHGYHFSSFPDIFGKRNSKILAPRDWINKWFGDAMETGREEFEETMKYYLSNKMSKFNNLFLEETQNAIQLEETQVEETQEAI
jgi:REP element-mobilizing transposase RayT